jgi:hypothetical protein
MCSFFNDCCRKSDQAATPPNQKQSFALPQLQLFKPLERKVLV